MDSDINVKDLLETRDGILGDLILNINSWDGSVESGIDIIEKNRVEIDKLKSLEEILGNYNLSYKNKDYTDSIGIILAGEQKILDSLSKRQNEVKSIIKQLSHKDKIKDNYIKQNKNSIFIDRNF